MKDTPDNTHNLQMSDQETRVDLYIASLDSFKLLIEYATATKQPRRSSSVLESQPQLKFNVQCRPKGTNSCVGEDTASRKSCSHAILSQKQFDPAAQPTPVGTLSTTQIAHQQLRDRQTCAPPRMVPCTRYCRSFIRSASTAREAAPDTTP